MLVFADADVVQPEHIVEFFGLLGGGQQDAGLDGSHRSVARLGVLPGLGYADRLLSRPLGQTLAAKGHSVVT